MPSETEFNAALTEIVGYLENTGREIVGEIDDENDEGAPISGFQCRQGTFDFVIYGSPELPRFRLVARHDLILEIAQIQVAAEMSENSDEVPEFTDERRKAAMEELERINGEADEEFVDKLHFRLMDRLSVPHATFGLEHTESGGLRAFTVEKNVFVYEDGFSISDFDEDVQSVVGTAFPAQLMLDRAYGIRSIADEEPESKTDELSPSSPGSRGFQ